MKEALMTKIKDDLMKHFLDYGLLEVVEQYWTLRAEMAARSLVGIADKERTDMVKGQISICYEMADNARTAREAAKPDDKGGGSVILGGSLSSV